MKSINKILPHCFRYFDSPISWMDGNEAEFIRVTLKAGIFAIIFDGFDEYALWNKGEVRALDVLTALNDLAISTGGRILLTSRTSFWESNFSDSDSIVTKVFKLLPFDQQHAKNYFKGRLPLKSAQGRAIDIFNNLAKLDQEFSGRGFMLSLIADLARDSSASSRGAKMNTPATLNWILISLCEREIKRRSLQMSAAQQIEAFQLLAFDTIRGHELSTGHIETAIQLAQPALDESGSLTDSIDKLKHHPLVQWDNARQSWQWKHEQVEIMLVGHYLCNCLNDRARLEKFSDVTLNASRRIDVADAVISISLAGGGMGNDNLGRLARSLMTVDTVEGRNEGRKLGAAIAFRAVDRIVPQGGERGERTKALIRYCGGTANELHGLVIENAVISSMDFSDALFVDCHFEKVTWVRCSFTDRTEFRGCHFRGGNDFRCEGIGRSRFVEIVPDLDATTWIAAIQTQAGTRKYSLDDLDSDLKSVLDKFIGKSGRGTVTVAERDIGRGRIQGSKHREAILAEIKKYVLDRHTISGRTAAGFHVRSTAADAMQHYAEHNGFVDVLRELRERLARRLRD